MKCSKICSKGFRKPFKLLWTSNALVHKPFVQNAEKSSDINYKSVAVRFVFSKRSVKFHCWNLSSSRKEFPIGNSLRSTKQLCFFFWIWGLNRRLRRATWTFSRAARAKRLSLRTNMSRCQRLPWETGGDPWLVRILWWKTPGLARGNSWCLWTWKSKSEITKILVQMSCWSLERRASKLYHIGATCTWKPVGCP